MSGTKDDYKTLLGRLLPPGLDFAALDPRVGRLLAGLGRVFARADEAAEDFTNDAVADHATGDRLASWEDATALPDPDYPPTAGDDAARQAEVRRVLGQGHIPTPAFYESLATVWGLVSRCAEYAGWPYHAWLFGPPAHIRVFRCGMKCGAPLRNASGTWEHVERLCRRYKPAHIRLHFADEVQ
mgnify:CR=1 FL=1